MRRLLALLASTALVALVACTPDRTDVGAPAPVGTSSSNGSTPGVAPSATSAPTDSGSAGTTPSASKTPGTASTPSRNPEPSAEPDPISMQALIERQYNGGGLRIGALQDDVGPYRRYLVTYRSQGLRISGMLFVPDGKGPFPAVVTAHGYIPPYRYFPGQGMPREEDWLARQGYVVLHTDYRNHATSGNDGDNDYKLRLTYTVDAINAGLALQNLSAESRSTINVDGDKVGILGRSMGGEVTLRAIAVAPTVFKAAVVYASTSSLAADNYRQFYDGDADRSGTNARIERTYGLPADNPQFWRNASARPFFDRVQTPLQMHHGTEDEQCPYPWATATRDALLRADKQVRLYTYEGEMHTFEPQWQRSIRRTTAFFDRELA